MKRRWMVAILLVLLTMSGCSDMFSGSYYSAEPHPQDPVLMYETNYEAADIQDLRDIIKEMVEDYQTQAVILVDGYDKDRLDEDLKEAYLDVIELDPLAAYAVQGFVTKVGKAEGKTVVTLSIEYNYDENHLQGVRKVATMDEAIPYIHAALAGLEAGVTVYVDSYEECDLVQVVEGYALANPHLVMEVPQVSVNVYPYAGTARVVEVYFNYRTDRASLKRMKEMVGQIFDSADLYVSDTVPDFQKYLQLWSFLKERFDYRYEASITPAYSLLYHGVGDSRAFAQVYAAMCSQEGLECQVVSGTRHAASRYWVIIRVEETYYHLDIMERMFNYRSDEEMEGYVWDYSAHPACGVADGETTAPEDAAP